ncbi:hypothetical protein ACYZT7_10425 [Pseudomonas sp. RT4P38]
MIASAFGDELQAIHHVGSTAVPGLSKALSSAKA